MRNVKEEWIAELCSAVESTRAHGAKQVYETGCNLTDQAVHSWSNNEELARLFGAVPQITVGLAVKPETFAAIREANGSPQLADVPADQDASEFELHFAESITLDILTTRNPGANGAIAKFLLKFGEGIQQVEFRCSDVDRATAVLRENFAIHAVYPQPRLGANGTRVNFFLVSMPDGAKVLIELYELPTAHS